MALIQEIGRLVFISFQDFERLLEKFFPGLGQSFVFITFVESGFGDLDRQRRHERSPERLGMVGIGLSLPKRLSNSPIGSESQTNHVNVM